MNEPMPLRSVLASQARAWGLDHPLESARLFCSWEAIVGERVALRCSPVSLGAGVLRVRTTSAAWATELRYLTPTVIRKVNCELGIELVKELKVTLSRQDGDSRSPSGTTGGPPSKATSQARRSASGILRRGLSEAEVLCSAIADERLAGAARRAIAAARLGQEP